MNISALEVLWAVGILAAMALTTNLFQKYLIHKIGESIKKKRIYVFLTYVKRVALILAIVGFVVFVFMVGMLFYAFSQ